jgi:hypothetical protein
MGGACGAYGGGERVAQGVGGVAGGKEGRGSRRERGHWGDVDGGIILGWIFRKLKGVVEIGWCWLRIGTGGGRL